MTDQHPIEHARDPDLRLAKAALQRAAIRARAITVQTGTHLVISHNGGVQLVDPASQKSTDHVNECPAPYTAEP